MIKYEKTACRVIQCVLLVMVLSRLGAVYAKGFFSDTRVFVTTANFIREGINPYSSDGKFGDHAIQVPTMSLFSMPLCYCSKNIQNGIMFVLGSLAYILFCLIAFGSYGFGCREYAKPRWRYLPVWLVFSCVCISSPISGMLRAGQNSSIAAVCLFAALLYPAHDKVQNVFYLGLAAAVKYSLMTMSAPVLILQKRWKMSLLACVFFGVMLLCLGFWVDNVFGVLLDYVALCAKSTTGGDNSYGSGAFFFLSIGFLKNAGWNHVLRISLFIIYAATLFLIWRRGCLGDKKTFPTRLSATDWGLFTVITISFSYHRIQDGILFMPFIGIMFLESFYRVLNGDWGGGAILRSFSLGVIVVFWTVPSSVLFSVCSKIGKCFPGGEKYFYYTTDALGGFYKIFPLMPCFLFAMAWFFFLLELLESWNMMKQKTVALE